MLSDAFAANCSSTWIKSMADANTLRQNCRVVTGNVDIGSFTDNGTVNINLDGVEVIEGILKESYSMEDNYVTQPYYTLSSSSLKKVNGLEFGRYSTKVMNLTLPSLASVDVSVDIGVVAYNLTYMDITSLDSAHIISIGPPNLTTLRHTGLRNVTTLYIYPMQIDSLDSLTDNPLNLSQTYIQGLFPNVNNIVIGFTSADYIRIYDNSALTLGGASTMEMTIKKIYIAGVTDFKRSVQLKTLKLDSIEFSDVSDITHLEIPFDNLRSLKISARFEGTRAVEFITLPPKAVNWTGGFELHISGATNLNWTSIYGADDRGNRIQTWYWPKNISSIYLSGVTIGNAFL